MVSAMLDSVLRSIRMSASRKNRMEPRASRAAMLRAAAGPAFTGDSTRAQGYLRAISALPSLE